MVGLALVVCPADPRLLKLGPLLQPLASRAAQPTLLHIGLLWGDYNFDNAFRMLIGGQGLLGRFLGKAHRLGSYGLGSQTHTNLPLLAGGCRSEADWYV